MVLDRCRSSAASTSSLARAAALPVLALDGEQFDQEGLVGGLVAGRGGGDVGEAVADGGQPQDAAGLLDRRVRGGLGQLVAVGGAGAGGGHDLLPERAVAVVSSWS